MITALVLSSVLMFTPVNIDTSNIPDSLYKGTAYYMPKKEEIRKCIIYRESRGNYRSDGPGGAGAYSFIQTTWDLYAPRAGYHHLVGVRPSKVPKFIQDAVFWRTWDWGNGKWHWSTRWNPGMLACFEEKSS